MIISQIWRNTLTRVLASIQSSHRGVIQLPNNLSTMIERSGMLKKDVAKRKGIRPETLTRHCKGVLQFTLKDAEEYGIILGCSAQDIMFAQHPIPVFGYLKDGSVRPHDPTMTQESFFMPNFVLEPSDQLIMDQNNEHNERWRFGAFYIFDTSCIKKKEVEQRSFMKYSVVKTVNNEVLVRIVYPDAAGKFSLRHPIIESLLDDSVQLIWSTPVKACCYDPLSAGATKAY